MVAEVCLDEVGEETAIHHYYDQLCSGKREMAVLGLADR